MFIYDYLTHHFGVLAIRPSLVPWVIRLVRTNFTWYHRLAHEINLFPVAHIVHYQGEDFNRSLPAQRYAVANL